MNWRSYALACASVLAIGSAGSARAASPVSAVAAEETATLGEIVVTARRKAESLQDVPQTVNAVTADALQKLQIKQFEDIQNVVSGLSLSKGATGAQAVQMRGVNYDLFTGAQPSAALYINDAPVQAAFLFESMFDIGQVEVLKGPQGTTRGISAPSGAITVTTRRPDLSSFGGYADVTATDLQGRNAQGALNIPLVKDVLALRVAAQIDQNDVDGVTSLHSAQRPRDVASFERVSLSYEPTDLLNANLTYLHMDKVITSFQQVSGPGQGTAINPPISPDQRLSVTDLPMVQHAHLDLVTAQIDSRIFGQHLSYVGSYQHAPNTQYIDQDTGNILPGVSIAQTQKGVEETTTQEVRLASDPAPGRLFDYTVGAFYRWDHSNAPVVTPGPLLPGAFGSPALGVDLLSYNPAYQIPVLINVDQALQETSLFGSVTFHLGANTELSGGIRHMWSIFSGSTTIDRGAGKVALPAAFFGGNCTAAQLGATYPGFCDLAIAGAPVSALPLRTSETPNIYNISLSHRITRDLLVYANTGTAYRPPVASVGLQGDLLTTTDPLLRSLTFHPSERSRAYEIGVKSTFWDERARLNVSVFRQRFSNLIVYIPGITYLNTSSTPPAPSIFNMTASVDALVTGFDIDSAVQVTPDWSLALQASYADGRIQGSQVPCNITGANGQPVFNTGGLISFCPGGSSSRLPLWNATLQSEYTHPVSDAVDGFLRALVTYYPQNKNRVEPNFTVDNYSLVNLYAGVRSQDGAWEVSIFARNALQAVRALDIQTQQLNANLSLGTSFPNLIKPSGYYATLFTPRREVGVNVHYAFGSR